MVSKMSREVHDASVTNYLNVCQIIVHSQAMGRSAGTWIKKLVRKGLQVDYIRRKMLREAKHKPHIPWDYNRG